MALYCTQEKHYHFNLQKQKKNSRYIYSNCSSTSEVHATLTSLFPAHLYSDRSISLSHTQSQLKDVEKLLKLDPGNIELLAQKQKLLSSAVSETKEKLATLKTAAEQANQALAKRRW